jgi:predicted peroxiredoxin
MREFQFFESIIEKGILLYSCHIVSKFLNIDTEHNTQQSQNAEARRR